MAKSNHFDFMAAANHGYQVSWENRGTLLRLAGLPLGVKLGCIAAIIFLGFEQDVLRHGLVMLPSYFAEGFLIAYVIRVLYAGDDLKNDVKQARHYYDDVVAAMIIYVLVKLVLAFFIGMTVSALPADFATNSSAQPSS